MTRDELIKQLTDALDYWTHLDYEAAFENPNMFDKEVTENPWPLNKTDALIKEAKRFAQEEKQDIAGDTRST
jgi:hypothetical protein